MVEKELNYASKNGKLIVPVVEEGLATNNFLRKFRPIFQFSRMDESPGRVEKQVLDFLNEKKLTKERRQTLVSIIAIGVGLLLLSALAED
jgi:hypothetical protein